jgi:tetratricopeptide (TPR) repeat protein
MDALFHKGIELAELENHKKAIEIFDQILTKFNDNANIIYAKSRSKSALGEFPESLELLKRAIELNPKTIRNWAKDEKIFERLHNNEQFRKMVKL